MERTRIGIISLVLLLAGIVLLIWPLDWGGYTALLAACWRLGTVMAALWLAYPQLERLPGWFLAAVVITGLVVAVRPKLIFLAVPLLFAVWIFRPRHT